MAIKFSSAFITGNVAPIINTKNRNVNLTVEQGCALQVRLSVLDSNGTPFNLTGFVPTGAMARSYYGDPENTIELNVAQYSTANLGLLLLTMTPDDTAAFIPGTYLYNIDITFGADVRRVFSGQITVNPGVLL